MGITMFPQNKFTCSDFGFRISNLPPSDPRRSSSMYLSSTVSTLGMGLRFHRAGYNGCVMSKKPRKKKKTQRTQPSGPPKKNTKYSAGEMAMAVLGAAILIMVGVIIVTSLLE